MKKTFPVNINGSIFYIDEDAYNLLSTYLHQLRQAFPGSEGDEIVADIEARISELFSEIIAAGATVITIDNVNAVIEKMGRPGELTDDGAESCPPPPGQAETFGPTPPPYDVAKKLYRNMNNKVFGGVLGGIACYFGWNANILRLLIFILALFTYVWPLIIAYLIAWMIIPAASTPRQVLEMQGSPVTIGNVGQTIIGTADPNSSSQGSGLLGAFGKTVLIFFGIIAALVAVGALVKFIKLLCGLILYWGWDYYGLLSDYYGIPTGVSPVFGSIGTICLTFCIALPCIAIVWAVCTSVFKTKPLSKAMLISFIIIEVVLIIAATVFLSIASIGAIDNFVVEYSHLPVAVGSLATFSTAQF